MENPASGSLIQSTYFRRYATKPRLLSAPPVPETDIIVTIPSYREKNLGHTLDSLAACIPPACHVEVLVLENYPDSTPEPESLIHSPPPHAPHLSFHILRTSLPDKKAGVGLARKVIMDEAAWRFSLLGKPGGLIAGLDADCTVNKDYLCALYSFFRNSPEIAGASIYFEHALQGTLNDALYTAIAEYELHLRYYIHAQRWAGSRYAYQTLGSSMAVRNIDYQAVGGMNTRKAGEDFYFLMKVMPRGFAEINSTCVYPSPRISDRVPFGTGKAMADRLATNSMITTYSPDSFKVLRQVYQSLDLLFQGKQVELHPALKKVFIHLNFTEEIRRIQSISRDIQTFTKHFHGWFDGFRLMKCLHILRNDYGFEDIPVTEAASFMLQELLQVRVTDLREQLAAFRKADQAPY